MIVSLRIAALVGCLALLSACTHHVRADKEMNWACTPDRDHEGIQQVEFHFVENPNYFRVEEGTHLCDAFKSLGKPTLTMNVELLGDFISGFRGSHAVSIKGLSTPFTEMGVGVISGEPGVDPLVAAYDSLARK